MTGTPKEKAKCDEPESDQEPNWEQDQKERGYYYDDAHGYETFDPEEEEDE
jgi:hypothetical protein